MKLSIVIPTANSIATFKQCVTSVRQHTGDYEIIITVNSPSKRYHKTVKDFCDGFENETILKINNYVGFIKACNVGVRKASGEYVCILNDDVTVGKKWAQNLIGMFSINVNLGAVGPKMCYHDGDFVMKRHGKYPYIEGWCIMIKGDIIKKYGLFDPKLKWSYCDDSDFAMKLFDLGYEIMKVSIPISHIGQCTRRATKTMDKKCAKHEDENRKYLIAKWRSR